MRRVVACGLVVVAAFGVDHGTAKMLYRPPEVATNQGGDPVAVWSAWNENGDAAILASNGLDGAARPLPGVSAFQDAAVGMDDRGRALAVWGDTGLSSGAIVVSARAADGSWSDPVALARGPRFRLGGARVAVAPDGRAVAAWRSTTRGGSVVEARRRGAGGRWSPVRRLGSMGRYGGDLQVAIDGSGRPVVAWMWSSGRGQRVRVAEWAVDGPPATRVQSFETGVGSAGFSLQAAASRVALAWETGFGVAVATRDGIEGWGSPRVMPGRGWDPRVAVAPDGEVALVWTARRGQGTAVMLEAPVRTDRPPAPRRVSRGEDNACRASVAYGSDGRVAAAWTVASSSGPPLCETTGQYSAGFTGIDAVIVDAGGGASHAAFVPIGDRRVEDAAVAMGPDGGVVALWRLHPSGDPSSEPATIQSGRIGFAGRARVVTLVDAADDVFPPRIWARSIFVTGDRWSAIVVAGEPVRFDAWVEPVSGGKHFGRRVMGRTIEKGTTTIDLGALSSARHRLRMRATDSAGNGLVGEQTIRSDLGGFRAERARGRLAVGFTLERRSSVVVRVRRTGKRKVVHATSRERLQPGSHSVTLGEVPDGSYDIEIVARDGLGGEVRRVENVTLRGRGV